MNEILGNWLCWPCHWSSIGIKDTDLVAIDFLCLYMFVESNDTIGQDIISFMAVVDWIGL